MSKQIPLRLEDHDIEKLEVVRKHIGERTANKTMIRLLHRYMPVYERMTAAEKEVVELTIKINQMKNLYSYMLQYKTELEAMLK